MTNEIFWAVGRSTGVVATVLLTFSVAMGIRARSARPIWVLPRFAVTQLHRSISLFSLIFTLAHVGTLLFDKYAKLNLLDFFLPFVATDAPLMNGLGTVALDLLLALSITGLLKSRLSERIFHLVHWGAYMCWPLAIIHGFKGSDAQQTWFLLLNIVCIVVVGWSLFQRVQLNFADYSTRRTQEIQS